MKKNKNDVVDIATHGLTKTDIKQLLGSEFNFFQSDFWRYELKAEWWETSRELYLIFEGEIIKKAYFRITYFGGLFRSEKKILKSIRINSLLHSSDGDIQNYF